MTRPLPQPRYEEVRDRFAMLGIRQAGDPVLRQPGRALKLPAEARDAAAALERMSGVLKQVRLLHDFKHGVGIAAPQIGLSLRVALVQMPGEYPIRLVNPRVVSASSRQTVEYEGCLSFFDFRGRVRRPWSVVVATANLQGVIVERSFEGQTARLVMHEIDHLDGRLYVDLLRDEADLIDIVEYARKPPRR